MIVIPKWTEHFCSKNSEINKNMKSIEYFFKSLGLKTWPHSIYGSSSTEIGHQAKIDNFSFKNSNFIIEGLIWNRKDYFPWIKFKMQKNNVFNKFYFCRTFFLIALY